MSVEKVLPSRTTNRDTVEVLYVDPTSQKTECEEKIESVAACILKEMGIIIPVVGFFGFVAVTAVFELGFVAIPLFLNGGIALAGISKGFVTASDRVEARHKQAKKEEEVRQERIREAAVRTTNIEMVPMSTVNKI